MDIKKTSIEDRAIKAESTMENSGKTAEEWKLKRKKYGNQRKNIKLEELKGMAYHSL